MSGKTKRKKLRRELIRMWCDQKGVCALCSGKMHSPFWTMRATGRTPNRHPTVDHIHPSSKGGSDRRSNLQAACHKCNTEKSDRLPCHEPKNKPTNEVPVRDWGE